jgi:hypothetical protein
MSTKPRTHHGEIRVGDHVITPLNRRAVVMDVDCSFGKLRLRYVDDADIVYLDEQYVRRAVEQVTA